MNTSVLNKGDIETPRTPLELRALWEAFIETVAAHKFRRNRGEFVKEFREEIFPALIFLEAKYKDRPGVQYAPQIGSQRFDGKVLDESGRLIEYIECTYAKDGQLDTLKMQELNKEGHVALHSTPEGYVRGEKCKKATFPTELIAVDVRWIISQVSAEIREALSKKLAKQYANHPTLIVAFEGFPLSRHDRNIKGILWNAAVVISEAPSTFREIWLVNLLGETADKIPDLTSIDEDSLSP